MKYIIKAVGVSYYWAGIMDWVVDISLAQTFDSRQNAEKCAARATSIETEIMEIS